MTEFDVDRIVFMIFLYHLMSYLCLETIPVTVMRFILLFGKLEVPSKWSCDCTQKYVWANSFCCCYYYFWFVCRVIWAHVDLILCYCAVFDFRIMLIRHDPDLILCYVWFQDHVNSTCSEPVFDTVFYFFLIHVLWYAGSC